MGGGAFWEAKCVLPPPPPLFRVGATAPAPHFRRLWRHSLENKRSTCKSTKGNYHWWKWFTSKTWKEALTRDGKRHLRECEMVISRTKRGTHQILIGTFIRGEKGQLWKGDRSLIRKEKGHVSLLKGRLSEVKSGTYRTWKGALNRYEKGDL